LASHRVCAVDELPPGGRKILQVGRASIGVFNVDGAYYAIRNICPHHGAQLCLGTVSGTMLPSDPGCWNYSSGVSVMRCPRHRWEFDLSTGRSLIDPDRYRVKTYAVTAVNGDVLLEA
jgi:nitrite reductase/ring-hydroxylating ferredoxin subunit